MDKMSRWLWAALNRRLKINELAGCGAGFFAGTKPAVKRYF
jgi:hypothetical protein